MATLGAKGGKASGAKRMENLTEAERKKIARLGARARWAKKKQPGLVLTLDGLRFCYDAVRRGWIMPATGRSLKGFLGHREGSALSSLLRHHGVGGLGLAVAARFFDH